MISKSLPKTNIGGSLWMMIKLETKKDGGYFGYLWPTFEKMVVLVDYFQDKFKLPFSKSCHFLLSRDEQKDCGYLLCVRDEILPSAIGFYYKSSYGSVYEPIRISWFMSAKGFIAVAQLTRNQPTVNG